MVMAVGAVAADMVVVVVLIALLLVVIGGRTEREEEDEGKEGERQQGRERGALRSRNMWNERLMSRS
jgi:hypothetical protein